MLQKNKGVSTVVNEPTRRDNNNKCNELQPEGKPKGKLYCVCAQKRREKEEGDIEADAHDL
jgi:hypothetical protein